MSYHVNIWSTTSPHHFVSPFPNNEYVLILIITDSDIPVEKRQLIARDIVHSRCRYALTYGHECSLWHDLIDMAYLDADLPDEKFLMTTWHDDEPIEDVVDFMWWNTSFDYYDPEYFGILFLRAEGVSPCILAGMTVLQVCKD